MSGPLPTVRLDTLLDNSELSDERLAAEAAREGSDGSAFSALVSRFQQQVWRVCYRLLGNSEDASDAAQEVFVRMFLNRAKYEGRSKYATWAYGIAVRTCLELRRSRGRRQMREARAGEQSMQRTIAGDEHSAAELTLDLMQMLETLDEVDRAMLILKYAEGHDYEQLAREFDLSVSACKMRVSRARAQLQQRFGEQGI